MKRAVDWVKTHTMFKIFACSLAIAAVLSGSLSRAAGLEIFVSVPPHAFVAEQLAGGQCDVQSLISSGQDPHTFTPTPKQIVSLSRADIFFTAGLSFEQQFLPKIKGINKKLQVVDLGEAKDTSAPKSTLTHSHEPGHHSDHEHEQDLHLWLSPDHLLEQAHTMTRGMMEFDPEHQAIYAKNLDTFSKKVQAQKQRITQALRPYAGRSFFVFHPAFGSFCRAFGLHQFAVENRGNLPSPRQLSALVTKARAERIRVIFCQPQFDQKSVAVIAQAINAKIEFIDPMAKDIIKNYDLIATLLKSSFAD